MARLKAAQRWRRPTLRQCAPLGADLTPDGAFGEASQAAYKTIAAAHGDTSVETDPIERLIDIARIHWSTTPFRVDLY